MRGGLATSGESGRNRIEPAIAGPAVRFAAARADDYVAAAFESHRHEIFSFLARATGNDIEAEELLQVVFLRLSREAREGRFPGDACAWLLCAASNLAMSRFHRRSVVERLLERFSQHDDLPAPSRAAAGIGRQRVADMERALRRLSGDERLVLLLASRGLSGRDVARTIGRTEAATRTMIGEARVHVRAQLGRWDG